MITNTHNNVLYTGVTNNLERRIWEHKQKIIRGFSERYNLHKLVYFEETSDVKEAILREKQIKGWIRAKKDRLVYEHNPQWRDLSLDWYRPDSLCHPERSEGSPQIEGDSSVATLPQNDTGCHPEATRKDLPHIEGDSSVAALLQNDNRVICHPEAKPKDLLKVKEKETEGDSSVATLLQNDKCVMCHPERSEGSPEVSGDSSVVALPQNDSPWQEAVP